MALCKDFSWISLAVHCLFILTSPLSQSGAVPQQEDVDYTDYKELQVQPSANHSDHLSIPSGELWKGVDLQKPGHLTSSSQNLKVARQQVITPGPCKYHALAHSMVVNCSSMNLATLNPSWFPANTTTLLLNHNLLHLLPNFTFFHLVKLSVLRLDNSRISKIQPNAFQGLESLENLNLENNRLQFNEASYPPGIFKPLKNLKTLRLERNVPSKAYPEHLFQGLTSLETLTLDTAGDELHFGEEFASLTNLSSLELTGEVKTITSMSFSNLEHLKYLHIHNSILVTNFSRSALQPLKYLEVFKLTEVYVGVNEALRILKPLALRKMKMNTISFNHIYVSPHEPVTDMDMGNTVLDPSKTEYLRNICVVKFTLTDSHIMLVRAGALISDVWKSCLKVLDLSKNPLMGTVMAFLEILSSLPNLDTLVSASSDQISYGEIFTDKTESPYWLEKVSPQGPLAQRNHPTLPSLNEMEQALPIPHDRVDSELLEANKECIEHSGYFFRVSDSLRVMQLSEFSKEALMNSNICFRAQNLRVLDISSGGFYLFTGIITGLTNLQILDVSSNNMSVLSVNFLDPFPALVDLHAANCQLDPNLMFLRGARLFSKLHALQRLDLASNSLSLLQRGIFSTNTKLKHLGMAGNKFKDIPFDLRDTPGLQVLDLSRNIITTLHSDVTEQLDNLAKQNDAFTLRLDENILSCACDNLQFLQWLHNTHVTLDKGGNYTCIDEEGKLSHTAAYSDIQYAWRKCFGQFFLYLSIILLSIMIIGFLVFFVIWKNSIFITSIIMHHFIPLKQRHDYRYDVFIGYAEGDYPFVRHELNQYIEETLQLQTYLHQRNMLHGYFATNIVDAISDSWRIVLVVTETFLHDEWSSVTCSAAISSLDWANPSRVVVLVEQRLRHLLPRDLVRAVQEDNIVVMAAMQVDYETREALRTRLVKG